MSTTVIIGTDVAWDYSLVAPWTALFWRDFVGYDAYVLLIGSEAVWNADPVARLSLDAFNHYDIAYEFVTCPSGFRTSNAAQSVRQHAAASLRFADSDWLMPLDADMWPLQRTPFHRHEGSGKRLVHYNARGDCFIGKENALREWDRGALNFQSLPSIYFAMCAGTWRDIYRYYSSDIGASLDYTFNDVLQPRMNVSDNPSTVAWYFDQYYCTERVCRQNWFPSEALLVDREGSVRGHLAPWDQGGGWEGGAIDWKWHDVHFRKGMYALRRWEVVMPIIERLIPQHVMWARDYFEAAHQEWEHVERWR